MTTIIFIPDKKTTLTLWTREPKEELLGRLERGQWEPPPPFEAVRVGKVMAGEDFVVVMGESLRSPLARARRKARVARLRVKGLSPRYLRVLEGLQEGLTSAEIGCKLGISAVAVDGIVRRLRELLGGTNRAQLLTRALEMELVKEKKEKQ